MDERLMTKRNIHEASDRVGHVICKTSLLQQKPREEDDSPGVFQNRSSSGALGIVIPGGPEEPSDTNPVDKDVTGGNSNGSQ